MKVNLCFPYILFENVSLVALNIKCPPQLLIVGNTHGLSEILNLGDVKTRFVHTKSTSSSKFHYKILVKIFYLYIIWTKYFS